jgi:CRISPR-associated endoribonuclease Cas6
MRIQLKFTADNHITIPVQYNRIVQAMIYNNVSKELSDFLHNQGFVIEGRQFKLFTFSRLHGKFVMRGRRIKFVSPITLTVASPVEKFLRELAEGMMRNDNLNIYGRKLTLTSVAVLPDLQDVDFSEEVTIKMLSPVVAYNTVRKGNSSRTIYFSPWDEWFSELIRMNLERKYQLIYGERLQDADIRIEPIGPKDERYCKVLDYKNTVIKGWNGIYKLKGNRELIKVAYDTGLGSKNSQGFGCFEVIEGLRR